MTRPVIADPAGGLYIHIPFCASRCDYCNFATIADSDPLRHRRLVACIKREVQLRREQCSGLREGRRSLRTVYVGGGTPSLLGADLLATLLAGTAGLVAADALETTVEANPESFTAALADGLIEAGVDRLSLGVQSLDDRVLRLLGRHCNAATARGALLLAGRRFPRVSADWILAPTVSADGLLAELTEAVDLGVEHISLYILELHDQTRLARRVAAGAVPAPVDEEIEKTYLAAVEHLAELGLEQYEVSNFARPGAESRHNSSYWRREVCLALGPAAHGFWGRRRYRNITEPAAWEARVEAGEVPEAEVDWLDPAARRLERLFLGLRTVAGVSLDDLPPGAELDRGEEMGWWNRRQGRLCLTARGFLRLDSLEAVLAGAVAEGGEITGAG